MCAGDGAAARARLSPGGHTGQRQVGGPEVVPSKHLRGSHSGQTGWGGGREAARPRVGGGKARAAAAEWEGPEWGAFNRKARTSRWPPEVASAPNAAGSHDTAPPDGDATPNEVMMGGRYVVVAVVAVCPATVMLHCKPPPTPGPMLHVTSEWSRVIAQSRAGNDTGAPSSTDNANGE